MKTNQGFIKIILILIVALLILSHYGISLRDLVGTPVGQDNISYVVETANTIWQNYLKAPVTELFNMVWNQLVLPLLAR